MTNDNLEDPKALHEVLVDKGDPVEQLELQLQNLQSMVLHLEEKDHQLTQLKQEMRDGTALLSLAIEEFGSLRKRLKALEAVCLSPE